MNNFEELCWRIFYPFLEDFYPSLNEMKNKLYSRRASSVDTSQELKNTEGYGEKVQDTVRLDFKH